MKPYLPAFLLSTLFCAAGLPAAAQSEADFYKGKTMQITVGYPAGGGLDAYARAAARYIGNYLPGKPTVIVTNMPGASSLNLVRHMQAQSPKDGTQLGTFDRGLIAKSVMDPAEVGVDFQKFLWIGSMNSEVGVCFLRSARGIKTVDDIIKSPNEIVMGGTSKNASGYTYSSMLQRLSPKNIKQVFGYTSTAQMMLAAERGEIDGNCNIYSGLLSAAPQLLDNGTIRVIVQFSQTRHPDLKDVQTIFDIVKSDKERKAINFLTAGETIGRPIVAPPGVPAARIANLRKAFMQTMKDPDFIAFSKKANLDIDVVDGEKTAQIVRDILSTPTDAIDLAREITK